MSRLLDWQGRLEAYLSAVARTPWRPGTQDCVIFAVGWRQAVTGIDLMEDFRGAYTTLEQGFELLRAQGWPDHISAVTQGLEECPPHRMVMADLVTVEGAEGEPAFGGCGGGHLHVLHPRGLGLLPLTAAMRCWRL